MSPTSPTSPPAPTEHEVVEQLAERVGVRPPVPRSLTGSSVERARLVVENVLTRAATDGERAVAVARAVLGAIVVVVWPFTAYDSLRAGTFATWAAIVLCAGCIVFSIFMLAHLRRHPMSPMLRTVSVVVDVALCFALLTSFVMHPPPGYPGIARIAGLGSAYFVVLATGIRLSRRGSLAAGAAVLVGFIALSLLDKSKNQIVEGPASTNSITVIALIVTATVFAWLIAARTRKIALEGAHQTLQTERMRSRLGSYVDEEVAEAALAADEIRLGGARREIAVLFSDLRDFTSRSERTEPEQLVRELNEYLEVMVACVKQEGGVVDKYIGDSIMAVFGAVTPKPDDALRAARAAKRMDEALVQLNQSRARRELPPLRHGIGVHKGIAIAGNIGTVSRAQYTVIGDTVNVAARLESATKETGVSVLVSQAVADVVAAGAAGVGAAGASTLALRKVGDIKVKGRDELVAVHTLA